MTDGPANEKHGAARAASQTGPRPLCIRCGHPVPEVPLGCKSPCLNCRFLYPSGDCSD